VFSRDFSRKTFLLSMFDHGQREKRRLIDKIQKPNDGSGRFEFNHSFAGTKQGNNGGKRSIWFVGW
jgi:hypothetical protein